ncbi:SGNH/GDSL hydrolase family protein [Pseudomonas putida]|uniref:SGNH/GDSL hydrolase family protein n=1 Tax=Pseudomonas putida TaxID=303 RepID=UPI0018AC7C4D|nr:SGNH/GDSL hydrolase family protein [Pseudomonas putida]MBF8765325.1 SGNH/GDSL hydrolase family protein [Pseudomonas putida]
MANNTRNPIPSSNPLDFIDNSENLDLGMNSTEETFLDRFGRPRNTYQAFHNLVINAKNQIDPTVAAAKQAVNSTAQAAIGEMEETAANLGDDLNNKRYASYNAMLADPQTRDAIVGVVDGDPDSNLNGWYSWDNQANKWIRFSDQPLLTSRFDQAITTFESDPKGSAALIVNDESKVLAWMLGGSFDAAGLRDTVLRHAQSLVKTGSYQGQNFPLIHNEQGQVIAWLSRNRFRAVGLDESTSDAIQAASTKKKTDGSRLWLYRARIAAALQGTGKARVIFTGDSWTEHLLETAQPLASKLYAEYGQSGNGWVGVRSDVSNPVAQLLNGAVFSKTGTWTLYDMDGANSNALDGHALSAVGTTGTITIDNLKTNSFEWWYRNGDGSFRYSVDGGDPVVVTGEGTGERKKLSITGLSDGTHTLKFDLVGNTGTVMMYGGMATRAAPGVEFSKAGNGGSTSVQWQACAPFVQQYAAELLPDLAIIILGTNDRDSNISKATFKAGLQALVNAYRTGSPNCCVLLVTPVQSRSLTEMGLLGEYADAMREISETTDLVEFIDLNAYMPPRVKTLEYGMWSDTVHLSETGGRYVAGLLMSSFLRVD